MIVLVAAGLLAGGCASPSSSAGPSVGASGAPTSAPLPAPLGARAQLELPITVWIDQPRQPAIDAYIAAHPDKAGLINGPSFVDREQFPDKVLLFNNTGSGWPNIVLAEPRLVGRVANEGHAFPLDLKGRVPDDELANYDGMAGCTFGDKIYCLRHDLAHFVTYYNEPLMKQFGYDVPTTSRSCRRSATRSRPSTPATSLGTFGDGWTFISFFDSSGCPSHELVDDGDA